MPPPEPEKGEAPQITRGAPIVILPFRPGYDVDRFWQVWTNEARRLAGLFAETGDWKHACGFILHIAGMLWRFSGEKLPPPKREACRTLKSALNTRGRPRP